MATEAEGSEEITAFEDMDVTIIEVVEEADPMAPRSRPQAMAIPFWVQKSGTPHRRIRATVFRQMVIEGVDILYPAIRLFNSLIILLVCIKAIGSKLQPFKRMSKHLKRYILQIEMTLP